MNNFITCTLVTKYNTHSKRDIISLDLDTGKFSITPTQGNRDLNFEEEYLIVNSQKIYFKYNQEFKGYFISLEDLKSIKEKSAIKKTQEKTTLGYIEINKEPFQCEIIDEKQILILSPKLHEEAINNLHSIFFKRKPYSTNKTKIYFNKENKEFYLRKKIKKEGNIYQFPSK